MLKHILKIMETSIVGQNQNDEILFQHLMQLGYCLECESNIYYNFPAKLIEFEKTHDHLLVYKSIVTSTTAETVTIQIFSDKHTLINYFVPFFQLIYKDLNNPSTSLFLLLFKLEAHCCIIDNVPYLGGILNDTEHNVMNGSLTLEIFNLKQEITKLKNTIDKLETEVKRREIMNQLDTIIVSDSDDQDSDPDESDLTYNDSDSDSDEEEDDSYCSDSDSDEEDNSSDEDNSNYDSDDEVVYKKQGEVFYDDGKLKYRWYEFSNGRCFRYYTSGKQKIYLNGLLESFNGCPAVTYADGTEMFYKQGKLHGPEYLDEYGDIYQNPAINYSNGKMEWYENGVLHRNHGRPAIVHPNDQGEFFYVNGQLHREGDLPAVNVVGDRLEWYHEGLRHRDLTCGPAVIHNDNTYEYWVRGQYVPESTIYYCIDRDKLPKDSSSEESTIEDSDNHNDDSSDQSSDEEESYITDLSEVSCDSDESSSEESNIDSEDELNNDVALTLCLTYSDDKHKIYNDIFERLSHFYKKVMFQYMEFVYIPKGENHENNFVECFHLVVNEAGHDEDEDKNVMISLFTPTNLENIQSFFQTIPSDISHLFINVTHQTLPLFCKAVDTFSILSLIDLE